MLSPSLPRPTHALPWLFQDAFCGEHVQTLEVKFETFHVLNGKEEGELHG